MAAAESRLWGGDVKETTLANGKVSQVMGPVVDVVFKEGELPEIYHALRVSNPVSD